NNHFVDFVDEVSTNKLVLDYSGFIIAPGLFDTHIHGLGGYDVMDGTEEAIHNISEVLPSLGVTRFLPTTLTADKEAIDQAIIAVKHARKNGLKGAKSEGIFIEG